MKEKDKVQAKLQQAFNDGFVPREVRQYMQNNEHLGNVWVVEQPDSIKEVKSGKSIKRVPVYRIGIGYKVLETGTDEEGNDFEREASHVLIYDQDEIANILQEIK